MPDISDYPDEEIDQFYDKLRAIIENQKTRRTYYIIIEDFKAKLGTKPEKIETYGNVSRYKREEESSIYTT